MPWGPGLVHEGVETPPGPGPRGRKESWLGSKDSNLDWRSQSPLSYH